MVECRLGLLVVLIKDGLEPDPTEVVTSEGFETSRVVFKTDCRVDMLMAVLSVPSVDFSTVTLLVGKSTVVFKPAAFADISIVVFKVGSLPGISIVVFKLGRHVGISTVVLRLFAGVIANVALIEQSIG